MDEISYEMTNTTLEYEYELNKWKMMKNNINKIGNSKMVKEKIIYL